MTTDNHRPPDPQPPAPTEVRAPQSNMGLLPNTAPRLRAPRAAGVAGLVFTVLLVLSEVLIKNPPLNLGDEELLTWFVDAGSLIGLVLIFNFGFFESVTFVFPAWVAFLSIYILVNVPASAETEKSESAAPRRRILGRPRYEAENPPSGRRRQHRGAAGRS